MIGCAVYHDLTTGAFVAEVEVDAPFLLEPYANTITRPHLGELLAELTRLGVPIP